MVRTKADAALRVAAGGKAPKKSSNQTPSRSPTSSPVGKDNFPVNRYYPRDTPIWQKSITAFFEQSGVTNQSVAGPAENQALTEAGIVKPVSSQEAKDFTSRPKRTSSELDLEDMMADENVPTPKKFRSNKSMEIDDDDPNKKNKENCSTAMDE